MEKQENNKKVLKRLRELLVQGLITASPHGRNSREDNAWNDGYRKGILASIKILDASLLPKLKNRVSEKVI